MFNNKIKVTQRGMITIPLSIRKKYHLNEGTELIIIEDEGKLVMVPLVDIEAIRSQLPTKEELSKIIDADDQIELELEN